MLLVDDEPDFHHLAREMLARLGRFKVVSAYSAEEALDLLSKSQYDIIVADYFMSGTNGIGLLKSLRASGSDVPFVMFTGRGGEDVAIDALNNGADFYLLKGGDPAASFAYLAKMVTMLVRHRAEERRGAEAMNRSLARLQELDSIVNQSPVIVMTWIVGDRWPVGFVSSNVSQLGYAAEDFVSGRMRYSDIVHPDDLPRLQTELERGNESDHPLCGFEYRVLTRSGEIRWIDERTLVTRKDGVPVAWQGILIDITDRKLAERRMRDLAMIVDSSHDAIYGLDLEDRLTSWNRAAEELYGYSAAEVLGKNAEFLIPVGDQVEVKNIWVRVRNGEKIDNYESVRVRKDGAKVDVSIVMSPVSDDSGAVTGASAIARDISGRKKAERLLVESELKYRTLFDGANDAIYIVDAEGQILDVNKTACEQTGYSKSELIDMRIADVDSPREAADTKKRLEAVRLRGMGSFETVHRAKDGREFPVEVNSRLIEYLGRPALIELVRDVSERKMSEDALMTVMSSLEDLESIVTASPAVVFQWVYSPAEGRRIQFASSNVQQFGYASSDLVSESRLYDDLVHPDDRAVVATEMLECHRTGVDSYSLEYRIITKDGSIRWVDDRTTVVRGDRESAVRHQGVVMDITGRRLAEDALKIANEKLNLVGSITRHDVANQLGILTGAMFLLEEDSDIKMRQGHIKMMRGAISTISQQLEFAGSYQKAGTKPPEWVHVRLELAGVMSTLELGGIKVEGRVGNMEVWADPMFERVLFNLFDNAVRHGEGVTKIEIFTEQRGDAAVLVFEDDGVGVPAKEKEAIFGRGYGRNTGHGLFLCREILGITDMNIVENGVPGEGSRFEILIPEGRHRG